MQESWQGDKYLLNLHAILEINVEDEIGPAAPGVAPVDTKFEASKEVQPGKQEN